MRQWVAGGGTNNNELKFPSLFGFFAVHVVHTLAKYDEEKENESKENGDNSARRGKSLPQTGIGGEAV